MTEIFESKFHKRYVTGDGIVVEKDIPTAHQENEMASQTYEEILAHYRTYVGDPKAELPEEIIKQLEITGKIK